MFLLNHRMKRNLANCTPNSVLIIFRMDFKNFLEHELLEWRIFYHKTKKTWGQFCASFGAHTYLWTSVSCLIHDIRYIFRTTGRKFCLQRLDEVLLRAFPAQLVLHQRSTVKVPQVLFTREPHSQGMLKLCENSVQFPVRLGRQIVRVVRVGYESLVLKKLRGWKTIDICEVRNIEFPLWVF